MYINNYELMNSFLMKGLFTKNILIRNFVRSFFKKKRSTAMSTLLTNECEKAGMQKKIWKKNNMCTWKNKQPSFDYKFS